MAEAGLDASGVGQSLAEAREAKFLETPKGRVALISVASTFPDSSRAGRTRGDMPARPGLNPLRFTTTTTITADHMTALRAMAAATTGRPAGTGDTFNYLGTRFVVGATPGVSTAPLKEDLDEIAAVVKNAAGLADYTIVTIHAHEGGKDRFLPADFLVTFARAMVDAGADMFVGHGPHVLRGIELYKGKPIMYSLGDFIFQNETLLRLPSENYEPLNLGATAHVNDFNDARYNFDKSGFPADPPIWEAVVALPRYRGEQLVELALHPITLGYGKSRAVRGRPVCRRGAGREDSRRCREAIGGDGHQGDHPQWHRVCGSGLVHTEPARQGVRTMGSMFIARAVWRTAAIVGVLAAFASARRAEHHLVGIDGVVTDESGARAARRHCHRHEPGAAGATAHRRSPTAQGRYRFIDLPRGTYQLRFELAGFDPLVRQGLEMNAGFAARVNVTLKVGTLQETVTVSGASPVVDLTTTRGGQNVSTDLISIALPGLKQMADVIADDARPALRPTATSPAPSA